MREGRDCEKECGGQVLEWNVEGKTWKSKDGVKEVEGEGREVEGEGREVEGEGREVKMLSFMLYSCFMFVFLYSCSPSAEDLPLPAFVL